MDFFKAFAVDEKLEVEGRWVEMTPGVSFKIAAQPNPSYARAFTTAYNAMKDKLDTAGKSDEEKAAIDARAEEMVIGVEAKTILVDWKVSGASKVEFNGEDLGKYSVEGATKLLSLRRLRTKVLELANDEAAYLLNREAANSKN